MRSSTSRSSPALALLAAAALAALAACRDSSPTAPRGVTLTIQAVPNGTTDFSADTAGNPMIGCVVGFTATAHGAGTAGWLGAMYRFYYGKTRTTPDATFTLYGGEVSKAWQSDTIVAGSTESSDWYFAAGIPFSGEVDFQYSDAVDTLTKHASARFTCGPRVSDSTQPPVIDTVMMVPSSGILPAGVPLTVSYQASSDVGIWQTAVRLTGPCVYQQAFFEQLHGNTRHDLSIPMPTTCLHDVPMYVDVAVIDAAAQGVAASITSPLVIENRVPAGGGSLLLPSRSSDLAALGFTTFGMTRRKLPPAAFDPRPRRPRAVAATSRRYSPIQ